MNTKLTLSVEKQVIQKAKRYAKQTGRSLSNIVQTHLENLIREEKPDETSQKLKNLIGAVELPKNFDEDKERREYLENKHL